MHIPKSNRLIFLVGIVLLSGNLIAQDSQTDTLRLKAYDINFYKIDLEVNNLNTNIRGNVLIEASLINQQIDSIALELSGQANIDSVFLNTRKKSFRQVDNQFFIPFTEPVNEGELFTIHIYYDITNAEVNQRRGISNDQLLSGKSVTWTLTEPRYAKSWIPCKQILEDKIDSAYLYFTVGDSLKVGSNGVLHNINSLDSNKIRYEWKTFHPTAFYLFSFAVADYLDYSFMADINKTDSVLIQNFIYNDSSKLESLRKDIDITSDLLKSFSEVFGEYPFADEKYGHSMAPIGGGMEHQTMTTLGSFGFELVAHELAHQWFGNSTTCSRWQDIWINEGFASYSEFIAYEQLESVNEQKTWLIDAKSLVISKGDGSVVIPDDELNNDSRIFNYRTTYQKGALIIHMIRHEINNDDLFFFIIREFLERYKNSVASASDFKTLLEELSGLDFTNFFEQWYFGEGHPILDIKWQTKNDSLIIHLSQETTSGHITPHFQLFLDMKIIYLGGDTLIQYRMENPEATLSIPMKHKVFNIIPDPDHWLLAEFKGTQRIFNANQKGQFAAFPNPTYSEVYIENYQIGLPFVAKLYNSKGRFLEVKEASEAFVIFSLDSVSTGIYQIIVSRDSHQEVFKIVKL